ncbi:unnamed protein product, partial [Aphanomyces euteiches]
QILSTIHCFTKRTRPSCQGIASSRRFGRCNHRDGLYCVASCLVRVFIGPPRCRPGITSSWRFCELYRQ